MSRRLHRVNDLLQEELSLLLQREVKDPRLSGFLTITRVEVSSDLRHARVYVSVLAEDKGRALEGLASAAGFLRHHLRERLSLKYIPELHFVLDSSLEEGTRLFHRLEGET